MKRSVLAALAAAFFVVAAPVLVFATDGAAPGRRGSVRLRNHQCDVGVGATVSQAGQAITCLQGSVAMVMLQKLPANIVAIFGNTLVEAAMARRLDQEFLLLAASTTSSAALACALLYNPDRSILGPP
jgi:hypothetical protein